MKILNVIHRYAPAIGGSELWCEEVSKYLVRQGHSVHVLTLKVISEDEYWGELHPLTEGLASDEQNLGVIIHRFDRSIPAKITYTVLYDWFFDKLLNICFYGPHSYKMYWQMWKHVRWADLIMLHTLPHSHNFIGLVTAKLFGKKTISVPHFHPTHPNYERPANYWLLRHCDRVIVDTSFERDHLVHNGVPNSKIDVVGVGIDPAAYCPVDLETFKKKIHSTYSTHGGETHLTFIGRKVPAKGIQELFKAVRAVRERFPVRLFLAGPSTDWFNHAYSELSPGAKEFIIDLGELSHEDKVNLLHMSDLVVLPSYFEAFAIVLLEGWLCGASVLGTREGAVSSVIGEDGFLCKSGDSDDLTRVLMDALSNPDRLRATATSGKGKVLRNYTTDIIGHKVHVIVERTLSSKESESVVSGESHG